jgi:predicted nuclease of predicted toxin-antitoxin system
MKILLDECLALDVRHSFPNHDAHTAQWAGLKGKANSELLRAAELAGYDVLLTVDQGIPQQQRAGGRKLAIILLRARTNQMEDLLPSVDAIFEALQSIKPGQIVRIPDGCSPLGKALLWWARGLFS